MQDSGLSLRWPTVGARQCPKAEPEEFKVICVLRFREVSGLTFEAFRSGAEAESCGSTLQELKPFFFWGGGGFGGGHPPRSKANREASLRPNT